MSGFFGVRNWEEFQHYKDRDPAWIKLYNRLLDDYAFGLLPDSRKWHLIGIFLLASRHNNRIPCDPQWLARQIGAASPVDLAQLERAGFIARVEDAADLFCRNVTGAFDLLRNPASPEKKRGEQTREEDTLLSAGADPPDVSKGLLEGILEDQKKKPSYPEDFEAFWKSYPVDPLMSKIKAFDQWRRMSAADRAAAQAAVPAFRDYARRQINYRIVHAQRYLAERRYEGFAGVPAPDAEQVAAAKDRADRLLKRGKYAETYQ